jgi:Linear amide C-N hydrolases, choloylglycine hydrolase family
MRRSLSILILLVVSSPAAFPCTTFCTSGGGEVLYGRNYDFEIGQGYVMTNRRGVAKTSMAGTLHWTSRYASVTFNQWGREFPMDGMNEAGLVIALMWLDGTVYPSDNRPRLSVLEWIQYGLDNHGSVAELLAQIDLVRISGGTPLHYLIADATGDAATIEYLGGQLVVHRGATLPSTVLANDSYASSMAYLRRFAGFGGTLAAPSGGSSLDRFARASSMLRSAPPSVGRAFEILASVAQPGSTRWSVVYDAARREISWVSERNRERRVLRFSGLELECSSEAKMLDVHSGLTGDVTQRLEPYDAWRNRALVVSSYAATSFTRTLPSSHALADAAHAEASACAAPRRRATRK